MKSLLILALYALVVLLCQTKECLGCWEQERLGLLELKAARIIGNYTNHFDLHAWLDDKSSDCCGWERVKCSNITHRVIQLSLSRVFKSNHFLNASWFLPFQELRYLDFSENYVGSYRGMESLTDLKYLEDLNLASNGFNESFLWSLGAYTSLKSLNLSWNQIELLDRHSMARVFTNFSNMEVLDLSKNSIPSLKGLGLSNMTKLRILDLSETLMYGMIPLSTTHLTDLVTLSGFCEMRSLEYLDLSQNDFKGILPACLGNLTNLRKLDVSNNYFSESIPPSLIPNLTSLRYISFSNNQFDGSQSFTSLTNHKSQLDFLGFSNCRLNASADHLLTVLYNQHKLKEIDLSHNNFHGNFPNWIVENNTKLEILFLRNNSLEGQIYLPLGPPTNLKWINVSVNHIHGKLQTNIGHILPRLLGLNLSGNSLEGGIPTSLRNVKDLQVLDLSNNRFDSHIPHGIFNLSSLYTLQLSNNRLTGDVTDARIEFSNSLNLLDIGHNSISGRIPSHGLTVKPQILVLQNNSFHGPLPPELCDNGDLQYLDLSRNQLSGQIPPCFMELQYLHLQHNKLIGTIPNAHTYPLILDLSHNNLSGSIPATVGFTKGTIVLLLRGNRLSGLIPHSLCWLSEVNLIDLSHNMLSGTIPQCFSNVTVFGKIQQYGGFSRWGTFGSIGSNDFFPRETPKAQGEEFLTKNRVDSYQDSILGIMGGLDLSCNKLSGEIPQEIGDLIGIRALNLSYNQLIGSIPKTVSKMKQIESLDLSHNKLTGEILYDLNSITTLEVFTVAYNNLSGRIPDMKAQFATFNETCYEGNSLLCGSPLPKQCNTVTITVTQTTSVEPSDELWMDPISFLASFGSTYIVCLLGIATALYINPYWRRSWFDFVDTCLSFLFPFWSEAIYGTHNPFT